MPFMFHTSLATTPLTIPVRVASTLEVRVISMGVYCAKTNVGSLLPIKACLTGLVSSCFLLSFYRQWDYHFHLQNPHSFLFVLKSDFADIFGSFCDIFVYLIAFCFSFCCGFFTFSLSSSFLSPPKALANLASKLLSLMVFSVSYCLVISGSMEA